MKIDAEIITDNLSEIPRLAGTAEAMGFDCVWANETKHDPFVQLTLALTGTRTVSLGTSIALAFTRSPTTIAYTAWDIQKLSGGRLILGLGSQVKGHVERRFGVKWESPEPKMREVILALRSVWKTWQDGERLDFRGRFFKLDLMTPFFSPGPIDNPKIPVYLAGVNVRMFRLAGELADGVHVHPLHTARYLRERMVPALQKGVQKAGRSRSDVSVAASVFAAVGEDQPQIDNVKEVYRSQIAFYASTRTYRKLMELHGWGEVCERLHELSVKGEWDRMGSEVSDEMLDEFVVEGSWEEIGSKVRRKYDGLVDRVRFYVPFDGDPNWKSVVSAFHG